MLVNVSKSNYSYNNHYINGNHNNSNNLSIVVILI